MFGRFEDQIHLSGSGAYLRDDEAGEGQKDAGGTVFRLGLGRLVMLPEDVRFTRRLVEGSGHHKQKIGKPVNVLTGCIRDRVPVVNCKQDTFNPSAGTARDMAQGCSPSPAGQNEFLQRRQRSIQLVQHVLYRLDPISRYQGMAGKAQFTAQVKERVLYDGQKLVNFCRQ